MLKKKKNGVKLKYMYVKKSKKVLTTPKNF